MPFICEKCGEVIGGINQVYTDNNGDTYMCKYCWEDSEEKKFYDDELHQKIKKEEKEQRAIK